MNEFFERITGDRWFRYLVGVNAYLFLVVILLNALGRNSLPAQYIFIACTALLLVRIVFLIIKRSPGERSVDDPKMQVLRNASVSIGYLALLAIVLGKETASGWLIYGLIGLTLVLSVSALIMLTQKRK